LGVESVKCSRSDGIGIKAVQDLGIKCIVLSSESDDIVLKRCKKLGIEAYHNLSSKVVKLNEWLLRHNISLNNTCYVGNDINDAEIMQKVSISIAVADSHPDILKIANIVTSKNGGQGAVREVCDWITDLHSNNLTQDFDNLWDLVLPKSEDLGDREWGKELQLGLISKKVMMKKLFIKAGHKGGLQYHRKRSEIGFILEGQLKVRIGINGKIQEKILKSGDHFIFFPGLVHQEEAITDTVILEASTPWLNDRVRVEDEFNISDERGLHTTQTGEEIFK
jgi:YrbI family 3-deoxy-D-manno-octulosonate 8-phosphate phosphatase